MIDTHKKSAPPIRPGAIRLDVHAHCIPLRGEADVQGLAGIAWKEPGVLEVDGATMDTRALYNTRAMIDWMDAQQVAHAWISIPPTLYRHQLDADAARLWTETLNRKLKQVAAQAPQRLCALLHLPMQHPVLAAQLAAAACDKGATRFAMAAGSLCRMTRATTVRLRSRSKRSSTAFVRAIRSWAAEVADCLSSNHSSSTPS